MSSTKNDIPEGGWLPGDSILVAPKIGNGAPRLWRRTGPTSGGEAWRDVADPAGQGLRDGDVYALIDEGAVAHIHTVERPPAVDPLLPTRPGSIIFGKVGDVESVFVLDSDGDWEAPASAFGYSEDRWARPDEISDWVELAPVEGSGPSRHAAWKSGAPTVPVRRETIQRLLDSRPFRWGGAMEPADFVLREVVGDR